MWDDIKIFLHVVRSGSASSAAAELKIDQSTVSRRIAQLERDLQIRLFNRTGTRLEPTSAAERLAASAERAELELNTGIARAIGSDVSSEGTVRITSVPFVVQRILVPGLPRLLRLNPHIKPEFFGTQSNLNLSRREADIALRLNRPRVGDLLTRRIGQIDYGIYRHQDAAADCGWVCYDESMLHVPEAAYLELAARDSGGVAVRVNDLQSVLIAVRSGMGRSVLPHALAGHYPQLVAIDGPPPVVSRDVWLLVHPDLRTVQRIDAAIAWIVDLFENPDTLFGPGRL